MFTKFKILVLCLCSSICMNAQSPFKQELCWAFAHPVAALKVKKIKQKAAVVYSQPIIKIELDTLGNGGKLDAFRHTFFMAAFAQKINVRKIRKLGIAHEKGNYRQFLKHQNENGELADSLANVMDLTNNELGFKIGSANKKLNLEELKEVVIKEIKKGNAVMIKRNKQGSYIDCDSKVIDLKLYAGKWFVPKCLVPSG